MERRDEQEQRKWERRIYRTKRSSTIITEVRLPFRLHETQMFDFGDLLIATFEKEEEARDVLLLINEHATLTEQRDRLVAALRNLIRQLPSDERLADYNLDEAEAVLATVEQGGES